MKRSIVTHDLAQIDAEIAQLWRKYRVTRCSSSVLLAIDALLEHRHELTSQGEMLNPLDVAPVSEYGEADLGTAA